jgi:hypothetical protein
MPKIKSFGWRSALGLIVFWPYVAPAQDSDRLPAVHVTDAMRRCMIDMDCEVVPVNCGCHTAWDGVNREALGIFERLKDKMCSPPPDPPGQETIIVCNARTVEPRGVQCVKRSCRPEK